MSRAKSRISILSKFVISSRLRYAFTDRHLSFFVHSTLPTCQKLVFHSDIFLAIFSFVWFFKFEVCIIISEHMFVIWTERGVSVFCKLVISIWFGFATADCHLAFCDYATLPTFEELILLSDRFHIFHIFDFFFILKFRIALLSSF